MSVSPLKFTSCMCNQDEKQLHTAAYYTAFHIPASLVIPAVLIHKVVHYTEHAVKVCRSYL